MSEQGKQKTKTGALLEQARFDQGMDQVIRKAAGRGQQVADNMEAVIRKAAGRLPMENQPAAAADPPATSSTTPGPTANAGAGTGMQPIRRQTLSEYMNERFRRVCGGSEKGL